MYIGTVKLVIVDIKHPGPRMGWEVRQLEIENMLGLWLGQIVASFPIMVTAKFNMPQTLEHSHENGKIIGLQILMLSLAWKAATEVEPTWFDFGDWKWSQRLAQKCTCVFTLGWVLFFKMGM